MPAWHNTRWHGYVYRQRVWTCLVFKIRVNWTLQRYAYGKRLWRWPQFHIYLVAMSNRGKEVEKEGEESKEMHNIFTISESLRVQGLDPGGRRWSEIKLFTYWRLPGGVSWNLAFQHCSSEAESVFSRSNLLLKLNFQKKPWIKLLYPKNPTWHVVLRPWAVTCYYLILSKWFSLTFRFFSFSSLPLPQRIPYVVLVLCCLYWFFDLIANWRKYPIDTVAKFLKAWNIKLFNFEEFGNHFCTIFVHTYFSLDIQNCNIILIYV